MSHKTIYAWIYGPEQRAEKLWKCLPRHKAKRGLCKRRGAGQSRIPKRVSIHDRPKSVENKSTFGHWEDDLMSFRKNAQHLLVLRKGKAMFIQSAPLAHKTVELTAGKLISLMKKLPKEVPQTFILEIAPGLFSPGALGKGSCPLVKGGS